MPRQLRKPSGTGIYHVVSRGNNKENIFKSESDKKMYLYLLKKTLDKYSVKVYAYCIMVNHVHILLKAQSKQVSGFMQYVNSIYAEYYNGSRDRSGHVFQGRYFRDCVETDEYFWRCMRYIHNNPVKINLVKTPYDHLFSSAYEIYAGTRTLVNEDSYKLINARFHNSEEFWLYHRLYENKSFIDTVDDERIHNDERVRNSLMRYMFDHDIENIQTIMTIGEIKGALLFNVQKTQDLVHLKLRIF